MGERVPLAPLTTLELGGHARFLVEATDVRTVAEALVWARAAGVPAVTLGRGSNVVVADAGYDGLVVRIAVPGFEVERDRGRVRVGAGERWDDVVARTVAEGLAGLECLSGIPGTAGATVIQNVGAYGQEVSEVIESVSVLDRSTLEQGRLSADECVFGYRASRFRIGEPRYVVLGLMLRLRPGGEATLRYPELVRALAPSGTGPTLEEVRGAVLELRRAKSMLIEEEDPNRRSVGSFFVNPVVASAVVADLAERCGVAEVPTFPAGPGSCKIPAAWLVERCGFRRGMRRGAVGVSSRHALALVHHGGGTAGELVGLAREIRGAVRDRFAIDLRPEPTFLGFPEADPTADQGTG